MKTKPKKSIITKFTFLLLSLLLISFFSSCKKDKPQPAKVKQVPVQEVKKVVKKVNRKQQLLKTQIDRTKTPYAGVWEPNSNNGFLLLFPDGTLEQYGRFDKNCKKDPKIKGTYKVKGDKVIDVTIDGKTKTVNLDILSNFVEMKGFGIFWPPNGLTLKAGKKEFKDPKKLIKFCRNIHPKNAYKIYPYLSNKSKIELLKVGILEESDLANFSRFSKTLSTFLKEKKSVFSITSIDKSENKEVFKLVLKDLKKNTFGEEITITKENDKLRCGVFDKMKLVPTLRNIKKTKSPLWYEELSNKTKTHIFNTKLIKTDKPSKLSVQFNANMITIKSLEGKEILPITGKFKIVVNRPNVVAISISKTEIDDEEETNKKDKKKTKKTKKTKETKKVKENNENNEVIVFNFGVEEREIIILNDEKYYLVEK